MKFPVPPDKLDAGTIIAGCGLADVRVTRSCASTNAALLASRASGTALLLAEHQTSGRGRRGRRWHSAPGTGLLLSLRQRVARTLRELPGLSLVAGVAALRALRSLGLAHAGLKWPNDILVDGAKLGGILVETRMQDGVCSAVIGIGINWHATPEGKRLRRDATCIADVLPHAPARNAGAIAIARALVSALHEFDRDGLEAFRDEWEAAHAHAGRRVRVRLGDGRVVSGTADGIGEDGSLRLLTRRGPRAIHSGTILAARADRTA